MTSETSISPSASSAIPRTGVPWLRAAKVGTLAGMVLSALALVSTIINDSPTVADTAVGFIVGAVTYIPASMVAAGVWLKLDPERSGWVDLWLPVGVVAFIAVGLVGAALIALGVGG